MNSSNETFSDSHASFQWDTRHFVIITAECSVSAVSLTANGLVLLVLWKNHSLHTVTNIFIGSLAAADFMVSSVAAPTSVTSYFGIPRHLHGCIFINSLTIMATNISVLTLLTVTFERFLMIRRPILYRQIASWRLALKVVGLAWAVGILLGSVPIVAWHNIPKDFVRCSFRTVIPLTFMVYFIFLGVVLPCMICMIFVYTSIFLVLRQRNRLLKRKALPFTESRESLKARQKERQDKRAVMCMAALVVVFALCWLPLYIVNSLFVFAQYPSTEKVEMGLVVLSHTASAIHPFMYAFFIEAIRKHILKMLPCYRRRHKKKARQHSSKRTRKRRFSDANDIDEISAFPSSYSDEKEIDSAFQQLTPTPAQIRDQIVDSEDGKNDNLMKIKDKSQGQNGQLDKKGKQAQADLDTKNKHMQLDLNEHDRWAQSDLDDKNKEAYSDSKNSEPDKMTDFDDRNKDLHSVSSTKDTSSVVRMDEIYLQMISSLGEEEYKQAEQSILYDQDRRSVSTKKDTPSGSQMDEIYTQTISSLGEEEYKQVEPSISYDQYRLTESISSDEYKLKESKSSKTYKSIESMSDENYKQAGQSKLDQKNLLDVLSDFVKKHRSSTDN